MSGCPCKADEIMTKAKKATATASKADPLETLKSALKQMASEAEPGNSAHRDCVYKLDATIKYISARWQ